MACFRERLPSFLFGMGRGLRSSFDAGAFIRTPFWWRPLFVWVHRLPVSIPCHLGVARLQVAKRFFVLATVWEQVLTLPCSS